MKSKENRKHGTVLVPFCLYECPMPELFTHVPIHWHEEFELNYIWEGKGRIYLNGEMYTVSQGDILVIPPNVLHAAYPERGYHLRYDAFVFHPSLLGTGNNDRCTVSRMYLSSGRGRDKDSQLYYRNNRRIYRISGVYLSDF